MSSVVEQMLPRLQQIMKVLLLESLETGKVQRLISILRMRGNPYMPIVHDHKTLPSGDHIALVEKLENPAQKHLLTRFKEIKGMLKDGKQVSVADVGWYEEMKYAAMTSSSLRHFFSTKNFFMDIETLPSPQAFREAAVAITELSTKMNKSNAAFLPTPDINETNVMWRRIDNALIPVLYDSVSRWRSDFETEENMVPILRGRLGMALPAP
jgi:replication fork clamp-binding protein CrfC